MSDSELLEIAQVVDAIVADVAGGSGPGRLQVDRRSMDRLSEAGLWRVAVAEEVGGSGGEPGHLAVVLRRLGWGAAALPFLEDHLAAELLGAHSSALPDGLLTVASRSDLVAREDSGRWVVSGQCAKVPWGAMASCVVAVARSERGDVLVALPTDDVAVVEGHNVAGEPRDDLTYKTVGPIAVFADDGAASTLRSRVLLYRSLAMLGAAERALEMTITHVTQRTQFGRALAHRQVVQHYVADMFGVITAAAAACDMAIADVGASGLSRALPGCLATRIEADRMASLVARLSHQLHGAMGVTQEHSLHHFTTRLSAWRQDDLSEAACALELSHLVPAMGGPWSALTDRRA
jgi:acyl-CoA dehydrogenase